MLVLQEGNIVAQMGAGIDDSAACIVFITRNYVQKVDSPDMGDNCKKEFLYADRRKTSKLMIPVVMETRDSEASDFRVSSKWQGPVGMSLGGQLYVDMSGDVEAKEFQRKVDELTAKILRLNEQAGEAASSDA